MYFGILHAVFDVIMGAVLLRWAGVKLSQWSRSDSVAVVWECLMSELRRWRSRQPKRDAADLSTAPQT
jgi:hypothetical protein